jgi:hypothetical protein
MKLVLSVVPRYRPVTTYPSTVGITVPAKPVSPIFAERAPLQNEFTEAELRSIILQRTEHWGGMTFVESDFDQLPNDYILNLYLNTRYQLTVPPGIMPLRASTEVRASTDMPPNSTPGTEFNPSHHLASNYILMAALFGALFERTKMTIDPNQKFIAMNYLRIAQHLYYVLYQILTENPTGQYNDRCVIGQLNEYRKVGDQIGNTITIFFDEEVSNSYIAAGATLEDMADYWLMNKEQPPAP